MDSLSILLSTAFILMLAATAASRATTVNSVSARVNGALVAYCWGTSNRSSSKNPSTSFTICSFTKTEDSNPFIYVSVNIDNQLFLKVTSLFRFCLVD